MRIASHSTAVLIALVASTTALAETTDLRAMWKAGQTSRYRVTQQEVSTNEVTGLDEPQQTSTELEAEITWRVTKADGDGGGTATLTIETLRMKLTGPEGTQIKAGEKQADPEAEGLQVWIKALVGTPITYDIDADGTPSKVTGWDRIKNAAGDRGGGLDEQYFMNLATELALLVGGKKDVEPGDTWSARHTARHQMGRLDYDSTLTFAGVEMIAGVPVAIVNRTADVDFNVELPEGLPPEASIDVKVTETNYAAQHMVDLSRHEIVGSNYDQTLALTIKLSVGARQLTRTMREVQNTQVLRIEEK